MVDEVDQARTSTHDTSLVDFDPRRIRNVPTGIHHAPTEESSGGAPCLVKPALVAPFDAKKDITINHAVINVSAFRKLRYSTIMIQSTCKCCHWVLVDGGSLIFVPRWLKEVKLDGFKGLAWINVIDDTIVWNLYVLSL